jgi:hypothetical protein
LNAETGFLHLKGLKNFVAEFLNGDLSTGIDERG